MDVEESERAIVPLKLGTPHRGDPVEGRASWTHGPIAKNDDKAGACWKFIWNQNGAHELYAVAKDPKERRNLVGVESERAAGMLAAIEAWRADTGQAEAGAASEQMGEVTQEMLDALGY
jgi:hypothetical protein